MQWWNDFLSWFSSDDGGRIFYGAIIPFVAILIAGIIGALIGRGSTRRVLAHQDRELQASAVAAMIDAGRVATMWSSLGSGARDHADSQFSTADIRLRLLPVAGSSAAADWATHELKQMQRDSAGFSFQADQTFGEYRDRLLEWQRRPSRARKLFALDLERFRFEDSGADAELVEQQRRWAAEQAAVAQEETQEEKLDATPPSVPSAEPTQPAPFTFAVPAAVSEPEPEPAPAPTPAPASASAPAPAAAPTSRPLPVFEARTFAIPAPVAATDHVNEADDADADYNLSEPHVESEEDPGNELDGVEISVPEEHPEEFTTGATPLVEPAYPYPRSVATMPRDDDDRA